MQTKTLAAVTGMFLLGLSLGNFATMERYEKELKWHNLLFTSDYARMMNGDMALQREIDLLRSEVTGKPPVKRPFRLYPDPFQ